MSRELRYERLVQASPARVFDLFTSPAGQREFYGKDAPGWVVHSRCELRVGGAWEVDFGPSPRDIYRHVCGAAIPPRARGRRGGTGDQAHEPQATGMLSAIVAPLAAGELPVWVASSFDGDLVLVPASRLDEAINVLRSAGHDVAE